MISTADGEAGFSLIEVVLCVGLLALGSVTALAVVPALARASQQQLMRSAATDIARSAIERVRAAVAYYPAPAGIGDTAATAGHAWAFDPDGSSTYVAAVHVHRTFCGAAAATTDVPMLVTIAYDGSADSIRVAVEYPLNPCDASVKRTVTLSSQLPPSLWSPQTQVQTPIGDPATQ